MHKKRVDHYLHALKVNNIVWDLCYTQYRGHAQEIVREGVARGGYTHVIAIGGDGSIAECAAALVGSAVALWVFPCGTANVFAYEIGIPFKVSENIACLLRNKCYLVSPSYIFGLEGKRLFIQMVGVGWDAAIVHSVSLLLKKIIGKGAYIVAFFKALKSFSPKILSVEMDGTLYHAESLIVTRGSLYAGRYILSLETFHREHKLGVFLFPKATRRMMIKALFYLFWGCFHALEEVQYITSQKVEVRADTSFPVQYDGDIFLVNQSCVIEISKEKLYIVWGMK